MATYCFVLSVLNVLEEMAEFSSALGGSPTPGLLQAEDYTAVIARIMLSNDLALGCLGSRNIHVSYI